MYGKDLIESAKLSGRIVRLMGKQPPAGLFYELFLDEQGRKISKSVGKGLTIDAWMNYAPLESLLYYIFQNPKQAKRLFWGIVPKSVDDYLGGLGAYRALDDAKKPDSTIWHLNNQGTSVPTYDASVNFSLINNLIAAVGAEDRGLILDYLRRYATNMDADATIIEGLVDKAMNYYRDFILPQKQYRVPNPEEKQILQALYDELQDAQETDEKVLQTIPFTIARRFETEPKHLFKMFYEVVFGQERGPRFGTFVQLVGKENALALLNKAIRV
jgi:lysyl-tRNA synthetase class 1